MPNIVYAGRPLSDIKFNGLNYLHYHFFSDTMTFAIF